MRWESNNFLESGACSVVTFFQGMACLVPTAHVERGSCRLHIHLLKEATKAALYCATFSPAALDAPRRVSCPSEHILIVRVLRARRAPGGSLPIPFRGRALPSSEDHQASSPPGHVEPLSDAALADIFSILLESLVRAVAVWWSLRLLAHAQGDFFRFI